MAVVSPAGTFASLILSPAGRRQSASCASRSHGSKLFDTMKAAASSRPLRLALAGKDSRNCLASKLAMSQKPVVEAGLRTAGSNGGLRGLGWELSYDAGLNRGFSVKATGGASPGVVEEEKEVDAEANGTPMWLKESPNWNIKMLYDGDCPLCMREVDMLRERNKKYGTIAFVDITADDYRPEDHAGISFEEAMGRIHGIKRGGEVVRNVEAFRAFYEAVGLGWVYAITKVELVGKAADVVYDIWARYRLPITFRPRLDDIIAAKQKKKECRTD